MTPTYPRQQEDANWHAAILLHTPTPAPTLLPLQPMEHSHRPLVRIRTIHQREREDANSGAANPPHTTLSTPTLLPSQHTGQSHPSSPGLMD